MNIVTLIRTVLVDDKNTIQLDKLKYSLLNQPINANHAVDVTCRTNFSSSVLRGGLVHSGKEVFVADGKLNLAVTLSFAL
ncbi:hypothetical protein NPIL_618951 [Nephila pilipes]|uniref:Uncharacterized protein n=1 Tax=Nephila pilipes TaxID=299642 RepID=A0A8X6THC0_NEPPI|nr:hypothetical protein NPIL_618951 [Nephila pilipes]